MTGWIINSRFLCCSVIGALFFSNYACALGFGEITLHSRIGEPLRAEVVLHGSDNQEIAAACYSLAPLRNSDLPVVTNARTRLVLTGEIFHLLITGGQPISEPVFMIGLRARCGVDLQRDYVLMPAAPLTASESSRQLPIAAVDRAPRQKSRTASEWPTQDGDTLESSAESHPPGNIVQPRRQLAREAQPTPRRTPREDHAVAPRAKKTVRHDTLTKLGIKGADRVMLGAEPEASNPGEQPLAQHNELSEMDGRMLKLETNLRTLNLQVENLSAAVEVTAEAMALRQKLQVAQAQLAQDQAPALTRLSATPAAIPVATDNTRMGNWLELLFSALAGGLIAGAIAHLLSKRQAVRPIDNGQVINLNAARRKKPRKA